MEGVEEQEGAYTSKIEKIKKETNKEEKVLGAYVGTAFQWLDLGHISLKSALPVANYLSGENMIYKDEARRNLRL